MIKHYTSYNDPSHGWLKVTRTELEALGIADQISSYSYERGANVYLEEDCDAGRFIKAKRRLGVAIEIKDVYTDSSSQIRGYASYYRPTPEEVFEGDKIRLAMLAFAETQRNWNIKKVVKMIDAATLSVLRSWKKNYRLTIN